jgi:TP901 family phage tail tape measure protein
MADIESSILIKILDAFTAPLRALETSLGDVEARAKKTKSAFAFAADLNQAAEAAGRFGDMMLVPVKHALDEFMGFERQMSQVAALSGEIGTEGFGKMREQALELGASTAFSSKEAAAAMAAYAQAGRTVNEILEVTPMTLAAARANGLGLAETASIVGHTMSGMGMQTSQTAHVVDLLTAAAAGSDASLTDLGQALAYAGPVARQSGTSLEMVAAYLGKMKDAGLEASATGTGFRAVLARLLDPSKEAEKAFGKLGIKTKDLAELQKLAATGHLDQALERIGLAANKLPTEQRLKLMSQIFGVEASGAANIMISTTLDASPKGVRTFEASLHKVDGVANKLAGVMDDNLAGAVERMTGALSGLATTAGELLAPSANSAASSAEKVLNATQKWAKENPRAAKATIDLTTSLGGLSLILKGGLLAASTYVSAAESVTVAFEKMRNSMIGNVGLVVAAGAAGWAIGSFVNEFFNLDKQISKALGRGDPETKDSKLDGVGGGYAGGWKVNAHGMVTTMGKGDGPAFVREARAAGATDQESINAFLSQKYAKDFAARNAGQAGDTLLEGGARASARSASPLLDASVPALPTSVLRDPAATAAATTRQTETLVTELVAINRSVQLLIEETRVAKQDRLNNMWITGLSATSPGSF